MKKYFLLVANHPVLSGIYVALGGFAVWAIIILTSEPISRNGLTSPGMVSSLILGFLVAVINTAVVKKYITKFPFNKKQMVIIKRHGEYEVYKKPVWGKWPAKTILLPDGWNYLGEDMESNLAYEISLPLIVRNFLITIEVRLELTFAHPLGAEAIFIAEFDKKGTFNMEGFCEKTLKEGFDFEIARKAGASWIEADDSAIPKRKFLSTVADCFNIEANFIGNVSHAVVWVDDASFAPYKEFSI